MSLDQILEGKNKHTTIKIILGQLVKFAYELYIG